jgi:hypothetical protein
MKTKGRRGKLLKEAWTSLKTQGLSFSCENLIENKGGYRRHGMTLGWCFGARQA